MKLALILYGTLDTLSGGYLYDRKLVEYLRARDHTVEVISQPWRNYCTHLQYNWHTDWQRALLSFNPDIILQDELNHPSLAFANARLRRYSRAPIISIVHHLRSSEDHPAPLRPLYRAIERRYLASVDGFIWNSNTTRTTVEDLVGRKADGIVAFPSVGDVASQSSPLLREHHGFEEESLTRLLFVGNLAPRKRLDLVLKALHAAPPSLRLDIVGSAEVDPDYAEAMRVLAHDLGIDARVRFHGRVDTPALRHFYQRAQLLIVPSFEGFGIVYLEAMAFGVPSIASRHGAAHELITHGETGYLIPPDDAGALTRHLHTLAQDPALLARMRQSAYRRFANFPTWDETCHNIMDWLQQRAIHSPAQSNPSGVKRLQ